MLELPSTVEAGPVTVTLRNDDEDPRSAQLIRVEGDHTAQNISLDLKAGKYAVVCFISDREGGEPHAAKGMLKELTVEE